MLPIRLSNNVLEGFLNALRMIKISRITKNELKIAISTLDI